MAWSQAAAVRAEAHARSLSAAGRAEDAERAFAACARRARTLGWWRGEARAWRGAAEEADRRGRPVQALAFAEEELGAETRAGDEKRLARVHLFLGERLRETRDLHRARDCAESAVRAIERGGDPYHLARALFLLATVHEDRGELPDALLQYERAQRALEAQDDRSMVARCLANQGSVRLALGNPIEARALFERARQTFLALGRPRHAARLLPLLADACVNAGALARALELYRAGVAESAAAGDHTGEANARRGLAALLGDQGRYGEALSELEAAAAMQRGPGQEPERLRTAIELGRLKARFRFDQEALAALEPVWTEARRRGDWTVARQIVATLGGLYVRQGSLDRAVAFLEEARREALARGDREVATGTLSARAEAERARQDWDAACACLREAVAQNEASGQRLPALRARVELGWTLGMARRLNAAAEVLKAARAETEEVGDQRGLLSCLTALASIGLNAGRFEEVPALSRQGLALFLAMGRGLSDDEAWQARHDARILSDAGLLASASARDAAGAFWFAEMGRALLLAEGVLHREVLLRSGADPALREAHRVARSRVEAAWRKAEALASRREVPAAAAAAARTELATAQHSMVEVGRRLQREARRVAEILLPEPVGLREAQAGLAADDALILYQLTDARLVAVVATRARCEVRVLGPAGPIAPAVEEVVAAFAAGGGEAEHSRRLFDLLLRPLEDLVAGARRLLISPDGALAFLPFEALRESAESGGRRALERWEIAYALSATVLAALRREAAGTPAGTGLVAVGDPVCEGDGAGPTALRGGTGRLERLPGTGEEVRAIAALFPADGRMLLLRAREGRSGAAGLERAGALGRRDAPPGRPLRAPRAGGPRGALGLRDRPGAAPARRGRARAGAQPLLLRGHARGGLELEGARRRDARPDGLVLREDAARGPAAGRRAPRREARAPPRRRGGRAPGRVGGFRALGAGGLNPPARGDAWAPVTPYTYMYNS